MEQPNNHKPTPEFDNYNHAGWQNQQPHAPESIPLDISNLAFEPGTVAAPSPGRMSSGATVPDPMSVEEGGRTWQAYKEGSYFLPNDALEQDRLDLQHHLWKMMMKDQLYWAPLRAEPRTVLDIGTGTGIWAIEFAEEHPESTVIGTDLSQIQPTHAAPPNCTFVREDVEDEWTLDKQFDFIHLRLMVTCFKDHLSVMQKVFDNLTPGGYAEYQEGEVKIYPVDDSIKGTNFEKFVDLLKVAGAGLGRDLSVARRYKDWMHDIGFLDIVERPIAAASGPWPADPREKKIGQYLNADAQSFVEGGMKMIRAGLGMSLEETNALLPLVLEDLNNPRIKFYAMNRVVYGRKPFPGEMQPVPSNLAEVSKSETPSQTE